MVFLWSLLPNHRNVRHYNRQIVLQPDYVAEAVGVIPHEVRGGQVKLYASVEVCWQKGYEAFGFIGNKTAQFVA